MSFKKYISFSILCFVFATICGAEAKPIKVTEELLQTFREVIKANLLADDRLFKQMETAADLLENYRRHHGHFPAYDREVQTLQARITAAIADNPYFLPHEKVVDETTGQPAPVKVTVLVDAGLDLNTINAIERAAPSEWSADPGEITVISNGQNLALVWGAGSDRKPIRDHATGKTRIVATGSTY